jgi:cell division protein ZapA
MPELTLEIGGNRFDVACQPGEEKALQYAAKLLDIEANRVRDSAGTEKRMLLLAGLMLADTMMNLEEKLGATEDRLKAADERTRIAEAKAAMLAANALKLETAASHTVSQSDIDFLAEENERANQALGNVLKQVNALAKDVAAGPA